MSILRDNTTVTRLLEVIETINNHVVSEIVIEELEHEHKYDILEIPEWYTIHIGYNKYKVQLTKYRLHNFIVPAILKLDGVELVLDLNRPLVDMAQNNKV